MARNGPTRSRRTATPAGGREPAGPVQSLIRGLNILSRLAATEDGLALTDLAQRVGLAVSTTHRLLNTLARAGFVSQDPAQGRWFVGVEAFTVGNAFLYNRDVVAAARPFMRRLMEQSGETVNLSVLDDGEAVLLSQVECREMMRMLAKLGGRAPLHASAVGKALLAALPDEEVSAILHRKGLERVTPNTIDTPARLRADLGQVRERGYSIDDEEHAIGLRCVAATIHDEHAEPLAAISLSGPRARVPSDRVAALGAMVVQAANEITIAMGGRLPDWRVRQHS